MQVARTARRLLETTSAPAEGAAPIRDVTAG